MKAVKSELAKRLLADPSARVQIRNATTGRIVSTAAGRSSSTVVVREDGRQVRYTRVIVPKAA